MKSTLLLALCLATTVQDKRDISIIGRDDKVTNGYVMVPHVAPVVYVRQTKGAALPEKGSTECHWHEETRESRPYLIGTCEDNVELVVTGLDLNY